MVSMVISCLTHYTGIHSTFEERGVETIEMEEGVQELYAACLRGD